MSSLQAKIEEENAYGSVREETPNFFSHSESDIDIINRGEVRKDKIIRFGPEKRKSIPSRDRVPSNTPVNEADEAVLKEIMEKVKSGGVMIVPKTTETEEEERRDSIDENPAAPIQKVIEDFERRIKQDSIRRRGSFLGQIYGGNDADDVDQKEEKKDPLEEVHWESKIHKHRRRESVAKIESVAESSYDKKTSPDLEDEVKGQEESTSASSSPEEIKDSNTKKDPLEEVNTSASNHLEEIKNSNTTKDPLEEANTSASTDLEEIKISNSTKDPLEKANTSASNDLEEVKNFNTMKDPLEEPSTSASNCLNEAKDTNVGKDPLEKESDSKFVAPQRRMSYLDRAEYFTEDIPRKYSMETQPLGHRQSIKDNLTEEFHSHLQDFETSRSVFVHSMLDVPTENVDPLDANGKTAEGPGNISSRVAERKKSDPLDVREKSMVEFSNGLSSDNCFTEIQEIMNRDFGEVKPTSEATSFSYFEISTTITNNQYPLNVVDVNKPKSEYGLKQEKQIPLNTIREIKIDADKLRRTVEDFEGRKDDVQYVYLNEMLLRCLIKLDSINVGDDDGLKQERRNAVEYVQDCIHLLDSRAEGDEPNIQVSF